MKKYNLLVVAHPDDETIFFGGVVQVYRRKPWKIICVTDGNADGSGEKRKTDFISACKQLKAHSYEMWDLPDRYDTRLDLLKIQDRLKSETPSEVFTHGILGEYGHPHHQDVCLAVHRRFTNKSTVWSVAYNSFSEKVFRVPRKAFAKKCEILTQTYFSETNRFARWLPAYSHEGFAKLTLKEIEAIYGYLNGHMPLKSTALKQFAWFEPYFEEFRRQISDRPF